MVETGKPPVSRGASLAGQSQTGNLALACVAEAIGTFMLVLVGTAVATAATLGKNTAGSAYDSFAVAMSFGLILIAIVGAIGQISGAHVNPAVTLGLATAGKFPWRCVVPYWIAQLAGAVIAALVVWIAYGHGAYADSHLGAPSPVHGADAMQVLLVEALIAFILVFTVISTATDPRVPAGTAALAIGFSLAAGVLLGGPVQWWRRQPGPRTGSNDRRRDLPDLVFLHRRPVDRRCACRPRLSGCRPRASAVGCGHHDARRAAGPWSGRDDVDALISQAAPEPICHIMRRNGRGPGVLIKTGKHRGRAPAPVR